MELALDPRVVGGVQVEQEELLKEDGCSEELDQHAGIENTCAVEDYGEYCLGEDGEGDGGVLEVVQMVGWDGEVVVEGLVAARADEEFHGDGGGAANGNEEGFEVPEGWVGEPDGGGV